MSWMKKNNGKDARQQSLEERRAYTFRLRIEGHSTRWIAKKIGVSWHTVNKDIHKVLDELAEERKHLAGKYVEMELVKINKLEMELRNVLLSSRTNGKTIMDDKERASIVQVSNAMTKLMERRSKLLGLDSLAERTLDQKERYGQLYGGDEHEQSDRAREALAFLKDAEKEGFIPPPENVDSD